MSVYKDKNTKNWVVTLRYRDYDGKIKRRAKRGFKTKKEAQDWEIQFLANVGASDELTMTLDDFYKTYIDDISARIRSSTLKGKLSLYKRFISPTLGSIEMDRITTPHILKWQNIILNKGYKPTYARSINHQLVAIFNHAERFYNLNNNPVKKTVAIGSKNATDMNFWTKQEFDKFINVIEEDDLYLQFNMLFYTGIRIGELIAIKLKDVDFDRGHVSINESAQYQNGKYIFSKPKTESSNRIVTLPDFLVILLKEFVESYYHVNPDDQLFLTDKGKMAYQLSIHAKIANVKRIRIHDLRHSHASLLIEQGIQPNIVQERLGHERIETTLNTYSHMYPNKQYHLASFLNEIATQDSKHIPVDNNPLQIEVIK